MTKLEWDKVAVLKPDDGKDPLDASYDWPVELDTAIDEAKRNGIDVALTVTGTPELGQRRQGAALRAHRAEGLRGLPDRRGGALPGVHLWVSGTARRSPRTSSPSRRAATPACSTAPTRP